MIMMPEEEEGRGENITCRSGRSCCKLQQANDHGEAKTSAAAAAAAAAVATAVAAANENKTAVTLLQVATDKKVED